MQEISGKLASLFETILPDGVTTADSVPELLESASLSWERIQKKLGDWMEERRWSTANVRRAMRAEANPAVRPDQIERIVNAYRRMKEAQQDADSVFVPARHWQRHIDRGFAPLRQAIDRGDANDIANYLRNFRQVDLGIEWEAYFDFSSRRRQREYVALLRHLHRLWALHSPHEALSRLERPRYGNPKGGMMLEGRRVSVGAYTMNYYTAQQRELIGEAEEPVVGEIGGGYGKMAYYLLRDYPRFTYLNFDLPETLLLNYYYLSSCFPERRFLLFGEHDSLSGEHDSVSGEHNFSKATLTDYDFILMPNFELPSIPDAFCDLFVNKNSLGEMNEDTVRTYLAHIWRSCRGHVWHTNHELRAATQSTDPGLTAAQYPVDEQRFERRYRCVDLPSFLMHDGKADIVTYAYRRRDQ